MGMYTELAIGVRFKQDLATPVRDTLAYMTANAPRDPFAPPVEHRLFGTDRWRWMLQSGGSYYFSAQPCCIWRYDDISNAWFLTVWTNIKNYTDEWDAFLDFILPHLDEDGYIGTYRYEEDENPTLLYVERGALIRHQVQR